MQKVDPWRKFFLSSKERNVQLRLHFLFAGEADLDLRVAFRRDRHGVTAFDNKFVVRRAQAKFATLLEYVLER